MTLLRRIAGGIRALLRRRQAEQDLDDELRAYLEAAVEQKAQSGVTREDALRAARAEIGSLEAVKDHTRDAGWESVLESVWQDVRYAVRSLRKAPGFTTVAVLTLALGIGANTAIFSIVNSLLLRPLPVAEPERLVTLTSGGAISGGWIFGWEKEIWDQIRQRSSAFDGALATSAFMERFDLSSGGEMQPVNGIFASDDFFSTLGVRALLGRTFTSADDRPGGGSDGAVAVISHAFWQRHFGGSARVIGEPLLIERVPFTIVGVSPPGFFGVEVGRSFDVALPIGTASLVGSNRGDAHDAGAGLHLAIMLRLKRAQTLDEAATALRAAQPQIFEAAFPGHAQTPEYDEYRNDPFALVSAATSGSFELRKEYERPLLTLLLIVGAVLLIACANLANLLLSRAAAQHHEASVKCALGATRWRIARQQLIESAVLASVGAACGVALALWVSRTLVAQFTTFGNPVSLDLPLDWRVLGFAAAVTAATVVVFGAVPSMRATRVAPLDALTRLSASSASRPGAWRRKSLTSPALTIAQVALSLSLLVAAGLFVRTFERLANVPLGFDSDHVLVVDVRASRATVDPAVRLDLYQRLVDAVARLPGVAHAAASQITPFAWAPLPVAPIEVVGGRASGRTDHPFLNFITPEWFATYGRTVANGRNIEAGDSESAAPVVVVNDAFVRTFFPDGAALGEALVLGAGRYGPAPRTIVGIVGDTVDFGQRGGAQPAMYMPLAQWEFGMAPPEISISARASSGSPPAQLAGGIAAALAELDPNLAFTFRPLADMVDAGLARERLVAALSTFFGALALLIAAIGLYGITSYHATERRGEIGIRMALGANRNGVICLVLGGTIAWAAGGIVLGLMAAAVVTRYLEAMLFGVTPLDPATFIGVSLLFAAVATLAAFLPARRATKVDPLVALRCE